jgi:hypothetical protein
MIATTCSGLLAALKTAAAGAVLALPAGPCAVPALNGINPPGIVTITSADPANPAVLTYLKIFGSSNLVFKQLEITFTKANDGYYATRMDTVHDLSFDQVNWHGADVALAPGAQLTAIYLNIGQNVAFTNSQFHDADAAMLVASSSNVTVSGDTFYRLNKGGVEMTSVLGLNFTHNTCRDFILKPPTHSDCIQGMNTKLAAPAGNLIITDNLIERGAGDPIQGIFIQDEVGDKPWANVDVERNTVLGEMWNAIWVNGSSGVVIIKNNTVRSWPGADDVAGGITAFDAHIYTNNLAAGTKLTITGNQAQGYSDVHGKYVPGVPGNAVTPHLSRQDRSL